MNNNEYKKKYEQLISFNKKNYNIILILNLEKKLSISINDDYLKIFYEINLTLIELVHFCKVFKSCDSIEDAYQMFINYFKSEKAGIKDISNKSLILYVKPEVLGKQTILELILKGSNITPYESEIESNNEISQLKLEQKTMSVKLENALETIHKLKNELEESTNINTYLSNQIKEIENENGDKYIGNIYNNKKEGRGKMIYKNGDIYVGEWSNDFKDGKGIFYYNNGNKYDGYFVEGKRNGKGIMFYKNGDKYDGEWKDDVFDGFGILYYRNGRRYIGEFQNDKIHGKGVMYYNNGDKYEGDWRRDNREGKGVIFYFDGDRYEGEWVKNKREGFGRFYYKNGDIEEGMYKESQKVGIHKKYIANYQIKEFNY